MIKEKYQEKFIQWIKDNFSTDYAKTNYGLDALFPTILISDRYHTVKEMVDDFKDIFGESEGVLEIVEWLEAMFQDDYDEYHKANDILSMELWSVEDMIDKFKLRFF